MTRPSSQCIPCQFPALFLPSGIHKSEDVYNRRNSQSIGVRIFSNQEECPICLQPIFVNLNVGDPRIGDLDAGDMERSPWMVEALSTCGHLAHTRCLQESYANSNPSSWKCPVDRRILNPVDVNRIQTFVPNEDTAEETERRAFLTTERARQLAQREEDKERVRLQQEFQRRNRTLEKAEEERRRVEELDDDLAQRMRDFALEEEVTIVERERKRIVELERIAERKKQQNAKKRLSKANKKKAQQNEPSNPNPKSNIDNGNHLLLGFYYGLSNRIANYVNDADMYSASWLSNLPDGHVHVVDAPHLPGMAKVPILKTDSVGQPNAATSVEIWFELVDGLVDGLVKGATYDFTSRIAYRIVSTNNVISTLEPGENDRSFNLTLYYPENSGEEYFSPSDQLYFWALFLISNKPIGTVLEVIYGTSPELFTIFQAFKERQFSVIPENVMLVSRTAENTISIAFSSGVPAVGQKISNMKDKPV